MEKVLVNIGKKTYRCEIAKTDEERKKGLSNRKHLAPDEGMLFIFKNTDTIPEMYMKDTTIPLDMIGIDEDDEVIQIHTPKPESEDLMPFPNCKYILEVNADSGIKVGDDFEMDDDEDLNKYTMKILAPDGTAQALLQGGERIFSRISTRIIIKKAKKAFNNKDNKELYEKDCRKLGKYVFKELHAQDHRDAQYVSLPDSK
jgi:uncharacterized ACR, COG1430